MRYMFCCVAALATFYAPMLSASHSGDHPAPHVASGTEHYGMTAHPEGGIQLNEQAQQAFNAIHQALPAHLKPHLEALANAADAHAEAMKAEMEELKAQHADDKVRLIQDHHADTQELMNQHHAEKMQMLNDHHAEVTQLKAEHLAVLRDVEKAHNDFVREAHGAHDDFVRGVHDSMKKRDDPGP